MRILDDVHSPAHYIDIELVKPKGGNPEDWNYCLTKKRGYDHRYQVTVTFETNVSQYDNSGMELVQKEITKAIEKALSTQPTLNENQQIVLKRLKKMYQPKLKVSAMVILYGLIDDNINDNWQEYSDEIPPQIEALQKLSISEENQVLEVFSKWVAEQEAE